MKNKLLLFLVVGIFAFTIPVSAQIATKTGSIFGKVLDDKNTPLPGVNVTLESDIMPARTAVTGGSGSFRFANLQPATYALTFSLDGFTEVRQEEVRVSTGAEVQLEITLRPSLAEEFTVIGETPAVDAKRTGSTATYDKEYLQDVPNPRDPWGILDQTAGIDTDRISVAGSEMGQQSIFVTRGANPNNSNWNYEGLTITDPAALGAATYYDFDAFEEINFATGGNDASIGTNGVQINLVLKRGTNKYSASASYFYVNEDMTANNTPDELAGLVRSVGIDEIEDWGVEGGGPFLKDRLFGWGSYRKNDIKLIKIGNRLDNIILKSTNIKVNFSENSSNESTFVYFNNDKIRNNRAAVSSAVQAPETLWAQGGSETQFPGFWSGQHTWIPNDETILTGRFGYNLIGFVLIPNGGKEVQQVYFGASPTIQYVQTFSFVSPIDRYSYDVVVEGNRFQENWAGGDHEFKFGFEWRRNSVSSYYTYGGGVNVKDYTQTDFTGPVLGGGTSYVNVLRPTLALFRYTPISFYVTDTFRSGRLTLNLGLRYDRSTGENPPATVPFPAGFTFAGIINPLQFSGSDPGITFQNVSPRVGATYDLTGDGKTVLRANYARYYDGYSPNFLTHVSPTGNYTGFTATFTNLNNDRTITPDELTSAPNPFGCLTLPDCDLNAFLEGRLVDPDLTNSYANEYFVGAEREIFKDTSVAAQFTHRDYHNFTTAGLGVLPVGISSADFVQSGTFTADTVLGTFTVPTFTLAVPHDGRSIITNIDGYSQSFNGLDLTLRKRMSNDFLINASATIQRQKPHYDGAGANAYIFDDGGLSGQLFPFDPSNANFNDDVGYAYVSSGSGKAGIYPFSEWSFKFSGVYQFPWDFSVGGYARYQQGWPLIIFGSFRDTSLIGALGTSTHLIQVEPFGSRRLENLFTLDLQFQKGFELGPAGRIAVIADLFNVTNTNTITDRGRSLAAGLNTIREHVSPRALRLGVRYTF